MASVVNTNVMSINAQRQLGKTQAASNEAMERLSSGLRINSAKDDAAGLAISTSMNSQITGITQAVRNSNDGISMAQTAEGAMDEMTNILQRMRELSVQSANDTNSAENRTAIQEEVDQLSSELDRIADTTEFNGKKLLDGSLGSTTLQIGANSGQTLSFDIASVTTNALGLNGDLQKEDLNGGRVTAGDIGADAVEINGTKIGAFTSASYTGNQAGGMAEVINAKTDETGVTASAYNIVEGGTVDAAGAEVTGVTSGLTLTVGSGTAVTLGATSSMDNLIETINRDVPGANASLGDDGQLVLSNDTGETITIGGAVGSSGLIVGANEGFIALKSADDSAIRIHDAGTPTVSTNSQKLGFLASNGADSIVGGASTAANIVAADKLQINGVDIEVATVASADEMAVLVNSYSDETGVTATNDSGVLTFSAEAGRGIEITSGADTEALRTAALTKLGMQSGMGGKSMDSMSANVSTMAGASSTIEKVDDALAKISASRAGLGAIQNRLDSTISNLENVSQNLSASNSRIQDADFAAETSNLSKSQILQQAGTSMLSQANSSAQSVLSLLG
jgi:flagellin